MSKFATVQQAPAIEVFALNKHYSEDAFAKKVNLGVGAYRTDEGKPWVLPVVKKMEQRLALDNTLNKEYLPVLGLEAFTTAATEMLLGFDNTAIYEGRAFGVQTLSGTGALRIAAEFLSRQLKFTTFYCSDPTWENHRLIFTNSGFTHSRTYRYWNEELRGIDFEGMCEDLKNAPENAVIILHACAHNPTGCDPTKEQWEEIATICQERKLFVLFDCAYQGFASGDLEKDSWAVRYFVNKGFELLCCQSFAKNFGLYNERVGNLTFVLKNSALKMAVKSQVTLIIRGMYSNPPVHGALIVSTVLQDQLLFAEWKECIKTMSSRINDMRAALRERLNDLGTPGDWSHITNQIGMFSYTGLTESQVHHLINHHHIYLLKSGRINIAGLTLHNIDYVAQCINETVNRIKRGDSQATI